MANKIQKSSTMEGKPLEPSKKSTKHAKQVRFHHDVPDSSKTTSKEYRRKHKAKKMQEKKQKQERREKRRQYLERVAYEAKEMQKYLAREAKEAKEHLEAEMKKLSLEEASSGVERKVCHQRLSF